ncbi:sugar-binding transcriptional regulator [Bradyrhizobium sp. SZCCHNR1051]|uniref:sugar-binding transcriptional regulator n=1 Tax=Bradyrhizobium sp. SZCCHNR1051 TaxID=3057355 RepID=UPI002916C342|nr:sugar-binding transcriptional regulator [Bradyrhizobium sp. SZCCHNR1051]
MTTSNLKLRDGETDNADTILEDRVLVARICWYYFKEGQTQEAISQRLNMTRKRVNRILGLARESGFVQITITDPAGQRTKLEAELAARYGLMQAIVVPTPMTDPDVRSFLGAAAANYVAERLPADGSLGITWGGTINAAAQNLRPRQGQNTKVVLLCGGLAESAPINPYDNAAMIARALGARCYYLTAPMFVDDAAFRDLIVDSEPVRSVLAMVPSLDMALLSAIDLSEQSKVLEYNVISRKTWTSLRAAGAVGDICGHYLDRRGKRVDHPLSRRTINPPWDHIHRIKHRVLAAGGLQKVAIIRAALLAGLCHVLVTDENAAEKLLIG